MNTREQAEEYVFSTKEEWLATRAKIDQYNEMQEGYNNPGGEVWDKYKKEADADNWFQAVKNQENYYNWLQKKIKEMGLDSLPGVYDNGWQLGRGKNNFQILGKKGWLSPESTKVVDTKDEVRRVLKATTADLNSPLSPEKEKEFRSLYEGRQTDSEYLVNIDIIQKIEEIQKERSVNIEAGRAGNDSPKFRILQGELNDLKQYQLKLREEESNKTPKDEKLPEAKQEEIKQAVEAAKPKEEERLAQKEEAIKQAASSGVPAAQEKEECPCGAKLSDGQKDAINWGRNNSVFQNPIASQINNAQGGFADTLGKINSATALLGTISGAPTGELSKLANTVGNMQGALSSMSNTSNRLSGLPFTGGGPDLLSLVSTVGAAVNFQCALGVEGLDVGAKVGLVTENGKLKLNVAINAQANLSKIMDGIAAKLPGDTGASDALQKAKDAIAGAQAELAKITNELNNIAGDINGAIAEVNGLFNDALDFVTQFTNINFALNFSNDPCTKFGVGFQQGILNPAFIERARAANPLNKAVNPGFGTSTR